MLLKSKKGTAAKTVEENPVKEEQPVRVDTPEQAPVSNSAPTTEFIATDLGHNLVDNEAPVSTEAPVRQDEDAGEDADDEMERTKTVMSEETMPVSVIMPPRKLSRGADEEGPVSSPKVASTGLLCGCI